MNDTKPTRNTLLLAMENAGRAMANNAWLLSTDPHTVPCPMARSQLSRLAGEWDRALGDWQQRTELTGEPDAAPVQAQPDMTQKLLTIIGSAYQVAGAHDAPAHILDVLADPEAATDAQVESMLPYTASAQAVPGLRECRHCGWMCAPNPAPSARVAAVAASIDPRVPVQAQPKVGCEGDDGLLRVHAESETCDVCGTVQAQPVTVHLNNAGAAHIASKVVDEIKKLPPVEAQPMASNAETMRAALERIARWHGEFPSTGKTWESGEPVSYGAEYGSNGERDYMRQVALDALAATQPAVAPAAPVPAQGEREAKLKLQAVQMSVASTLSTIQSALGVPDSEPADAETILKAIKQLLAAVQPVAVPDGFVLMPTRLTAENGAKAALSGEFHEFTPIECPECLGDGDDSYGEECSECHGEGKVDQRVTVEWDTIKRIYSMAVEVCAAPQPADAGQGGGK